MPKLTQNERILAYLQSGGSLTWLDALLKFNCSALNSRISDLRNKMNIPVSDEWVNVTNGAGEIVKVKKYYIQ